MRETTYFQCESEINAREDWAKDDSAKQVLINDECKKKILEPLIGTKQLTTLLGNKYQVMELTTLLAGGETDKEIVEAKDYFQNSGTKLHENGEAFNKENNNIYVFKLLELAKVPVETQEKWDFNKELENKYEEEIKAALQEKMDGGRKKKRSRRSRKGGRKSRRSRKGGRKSRRTRRGGSRRRSRQNQRQSRRQSRRRRNRQNSRRQRQNQRQRQNRRNNNNN